MTQETLPDGRIIDYTYDSNGNLISITPPGKPTHTFSYTVLNQVATYTPPDIGLGNTQSQYIYNADKQLISLTRPDGQSIDSIYVTY